jgi:hypothetical protein
MTATATVIDEREATAAETNGKERKVRVGLWEGNKYTFAADDAGLAAAKAATVWNKEKSAAVDGFRPYRLLNKEQQAVAIVLGKNELDAFGRYLQAKGYSCELADPKERGAKKGPKIDPSTVNLLKKMWAKGNQDMVLEYLKESPQYAMHFELNQAQLDEIRSGESVVVEE